MRVLEFWLSHRAETMTMLAQHLMLVVVSTLAAVAIGVPLGIVAARRPRLGTFLGTAINIVQTIPSLALFGFLIPLPFIGIGSRAAVTALILYSILPVLRTTMAGLGGIDPAIREAGTAMGMTPRQLLREVELPLATPAIVAGVRVATVISVGTATIAAAIGAGGLGDFIFRGLSMVDATVILAGAIPAALLALVADASLSWLERRLTPGRRGKRSARALAVQVGAVLAVLLVPAAWLTARSGAEIRIGSKNFTEQVILGELISQAVEQQTGLVVDRRLNLGGTFICDRALLSGDLDAYVEYTGTALTAIFHRPTGDKPETVFDTVRQAYADSGRTLLAPLGFNNTFAILVRGETARRLGLRTISDAVPQASTWRAGFGYEFLERDDGFRGLAARYGLVFAASPTVMDLSLIYRALAEGQVDLIAGDATNGLIAGLDLFMLEDDRQYFPPYEAAAVVRSQTLLRYPAVREALERLSGRITEGDMRSMNYAVDVQRRDVRDVAREFLSNLNF